MYSLGDATYLQAHAVLSFAEKIKQPWGADVELAISSTKERIAKRPEKFRALIDKLFKGTLVSCWYYSMHQSEAMWKLYSDQGKGIAIRTTVGKLKAALEHAAHNDRQKTIFIGKVKYLDYSDPLLTPPDCNVDGNTIPLLKRVSYSHENEVRAFLSPDLDINNYEDFKIKPFMAGCDVNSLIDGVYVSPYAKETFLKAVQAVVKNFDLPSPVQKSDLLSGADDLFRIE